MRAIILSMILCLVLSGLIMAQDEAYEITNITKIALVYAIGEATLESTIM